jgi:hypothetical protein
MTIKQSAKDVIRNAFVGKKFISSSFYEPIKFLCDSNSNQTEIKTKNLIGKTIEESYTCVYSRTDCGIALKFEGIDNWFFFFDNDEITVED